MNEHTDTPAEAMSLTSRRKLSTAPATVWAAFADPDRLAAWWGPNGFHTTTQVFDFRTGGRWSYVMHGPDGQDFGGDRTFVEVTEPSRLVARHEGAMHNFLMTVLLEPADDGANMTWLLDFDPHPSNESLRDIILTANEENFDRLEAHLAATT